MRFRKATKSKKAQVALTENEIVEACHEYLEKKGYKLSNVSWLLIPTQREKLDMAGRKRHRGIECRMEIEGS